MITKKTVGELIKTARETATWIHKNTDKNDNAQLLRTLWAKIHDAENELGEDRSGFALLIENPKRGRRITLTVENADKYLSRTGWESAGIEAEITYSRPVKSLNDARESLKQKCSSEHFTAMGMEWTQTSEKDLRKIMDSLAG